MKYRPEIDGLRALAVVPVILFHAGFELFSGGFVGVDVFFVISGYLITTILIEDLENQRFSIVSFYERRARRILPALFFVMIVCIPFAWMWMLPSQMKDFSQSFVAVSLFASNILFWLENSYFDSAAEEKPLLHTWSLAVEEQYYILFPIILILAWRYGKNRVFWMIVAMAAISLLFSEWGWRNKATANFYLAPTRAWELLAGSIAAFIVNKRGVQKNNLFAMLGLAAIIFSIFFYDETTPFPSVYSLVPVMGVVLLVLHADKGTIAAELLSTKGFVSIGSISYSAYLWHQPLFAFGRIRLLEHPSLSIMSALCLISILLAYLSWLYIEQPFRSKSLVSRKFIFALSILGLTVFTSLGLLGHILNGVPNRLEQRVVDVVALSEIEKKLIDDGGCNRTSNETRINACVYGDNQNVKIALLGDSHASSLVHTLDYYGKKNNFGFNRHTKNGCPFINNFQSFDLENCYIYVQNVIEWLDKNPQIEVILIAQRLPFYITDNDYKNGVGGIENRSDDNFYGTLETLRDTSELRSAAILHEFQRTIESLSIRFPKTKIVISSPIPEQGWHVPNQLAKKMLFSSSSEITPLPIYRYFERNQRILPLLSELDKLINVTIYPLHTVFCNENNCPSLADENALYYDDNHLSASGGVRALAKIMNYIQ